MEFRRVLFRSGDSWRRVKQLLPGVCPSQAGRHGVARTRSRREAVRALPLALKPPRSEIRPSQIHPTQPVLPLPRRKASYSSRLRRVQEPPFPAGAGQPAGFLRGSRRWMWLGASSSSPQETELTRATGNSSSWLFDRSEEYKSELLS